MPGADLSMKPIVVAKHPAKHHEFGTGMILASQYHQSAVLSEWMSFSYGSSFFLRVLTSEICSFEKKRRTQRAKFGLDSDLLNAAECDWSEFFGRENSSVHYQCACSYRSAMHPWRIATLTIWLLVTASAFAANPFLNAKDDKPVSATFGGSEWGDEIDQDEIPLSARVITTRMAKMPWGAIFKIEFTDIKSRAEKPREIRPDYFIVTDDRIVLLNEEDNDAAAKKISTLDKPPQFEPNDIYGITSNSFEHQEGEWKTTIKLKGDLCIYDASHPSGHFRKIIWKKGVGLVEYAGGYGARADGYRLKREVTSQKR